MAIQSLLLSAVALAGSVIAAPAQAVVPTAVSAQATNVQVRAPAVTVDPLSGIVDSVDNLLKKVGLLNKQASGCTFSGSNGYASASKSQASCATIVLENVAVPSGTTLDLSELKENTHVIFKGTTTWGYKEWAGPRK